MKMLRKLKLIGTAAACSLLLALAFPAGQAQASNAVEVPDKFDELDGDAKYLGSDYRDNYILDIEETGALQIHWEAINGVANAIFAGIRTISYATVSLFYWAIDFNMGEIFGDKLNSIQSALKDTIFEPLFSLACAACLATLITKVLKSDIVGSVMEVFKIILVVILSMLVILKSDSVLSLATDVTKEVSVDALASVNDSMELSGNVEDFAAEAAGVLWLDLVHEPWKTVEFMHSDLADNLTDELLTKSDAEERADLVAEHEDEKCFQMTIGFERVGFLIIYLFPCLAKCILYIVIAGALIIFQALAVLYLLLAPLMLLLFLFAGYERILTSWLRKLLETQVMILVIMLMLSLLIRIDTFFFDLSSRYGWFVSLLMQIIVGVGLFMNRSKVFSFLDTVQRGTATPRYAANRLRMGGNLNNSINTIKRNASVAGKSVSQKAAALGRMVTGAGSTNVQSAARTAGAGSANVQGSAPTIGTGSAQPRPTYRPAPKKGNPVTVTAHPDPTAREKLQQAGTDAKWYVRSGRMGRDAGKAAAALTGAPAYVKDSLSMAMDRVKSAPIQFRYGAMVQTDKTKAAAAAATHAAVQHAGETWKNVKDTADQTATDALKVGKRNSKGYSKGYTEQKESKRQEREEKRKAYTESVAARKAVLEKAAAKKQEKKEARRYIQKNNDKTNAQEALK
ncbi:MAG: hypothetical protein J6C33_03835 [Lachnospiraceae bacterium]|nr:hypothetical protein [Lachnospiraceae bacterium]